MTALRTGEPLAAYLAADDAIESDAPEIVALARELPDDPVDAARNVFHFVRDEVAHSWDIQGHRVTCAATEVLRYREGICYAKSHLAAALLRAAGIPSGICYQRLTLLEDDSAGYAVHALNTVYLEPLRRWVRFDARGNKPGVDAQFSVDRERLAFPIRAQYDEIDYLHNHARPHPAIIATLRGNDDALEMYRRGLPAMLRD